MKQYFTTIMQSVYVKMLLVLFVGILLSAVVQSAYAIDPVNNATIGTIDVIVNGTSHMTSLVNGSYAAVTSYTNVSDYPNKLQSLIEGVAIDMDIIPNSTLPIERISQGQCVELGRVYDISGIGWWETGKIAWYGSYTDDFSPANSSVKKLLDIPYTKKELSAYWIDPKIFGDKRGYWYMYYDKYEKSANNRLFFVSVKCRSSVNITVNATNITETVTLGRNNTLSSKIGNGIVIAKGDSIPSALLAPNKSSVWIFGESDNDIGIYDRNPESEDITSGNVLVNAESGQYKMLFVSPGENKIPEVMYNKSQKALRSPFVDKSSIDINGMIPMQVRAALMEYIRGTIDDTITEYTIDLEDPTIFISEMSEDKRSDDLSYMTIRGYTNCKSGTNISISLDEYEPSRAASKNIISHTKAFGFDNMAEWRQFSIIVPLYYADQTTGAHTLIAWSDTGAYATAPFYIREEEKKSYKPPERVKWADNSPYIEPTIIIKETIKEVPVIQEKIVTIKEPVDYETLAREEIRQLLPIAFQSTIALILSLYFVWSVARTYVRRTSKTAGEQLTC